MTPRWVLLLVLGALTISGGALGGCGPASLPVPLRGHHVGKDPVPVPFPPPPARADIVPGRPSDAVDPVWVDGQWVWRGRQWVWQPGQWWERPPTQIWAAPSVVRLASGDLAWFEGRWRAVEPLDPLPARREPPAP